MKRKLHPALLMMALAVLLPVPAAACQGPAPEAPGVVRIPGNAPTQRSPWQELLDAAKKEGTVMVYATELGAAQQILARALKDKFDIDLNAVGGRGPEVVAKLTAERRAGLNLGDIGLMGPSTFFDSIKPLDITVPLSPLLILPEVTDPSKWRGGKIPYVDKEGHSLALAAMAVPASIRNTDLVKEGEITSFLDYLEPKWKGKLVMSDPAMGGSGNNFLVYLETQVFGPERTGEIMRRLVAQEPAMTRDQRLLLEWVARGKYPLGFGQSSTQLAEYNRLGAPVAAIQLKESTFISSGSGNVFVFDQAPHPNAARLVLNWLLSKEGGLVWSRATGYPSMRQDVSVEGLDPMILLPPGATIPDEAQLRAQGDMRRTAEDLFAPLRK